MFLVRMFPSSSFVRRKVKNMTEALELEGPLGCQNSQLVLLTPLDSGGNELIECSRGISVVEGEFLKVVIPEWLAGLPWVEAGDRVIVENTGGKIRHPCRESAAGALDAIREKLFRKEERADGEDECMETDVSDAHA
jgi:hypothetical protein